MKGRGKNSAAPSLRSPTFCGDNLFPPAHDNHATEFFNGELDRLPLHPGGFPTHPHHNE